MARKLWQIVSSGEQVLGRDITKEEAREFTHMVRCIAAPELGKNYVAIKAACRSWKVAVTVSKSLK